MFIPERIIILNYQLGYIHVVPKRWNRGNYLYYQWELCWDNQVVVGKAADCGIRETIQNTISTEYLAKQTAGLFRPGTKVVQAQESAYVCEEGGIFVLDGERLEVKRVDGDRVMYGKYGEDGEEEDWVEGGTENIIVN
jgi:hypothetical protein